MMRRRQLQPLLLVVLLVLTLSVTVVNGVSLSERLRSLSSERVRSLSERLRSLSASSAAAARTEPEAQAWIGPNVAEHSPDFKDEQSANSVLDWSVDAKNTKISELNEQERKEYEKRERERHQRKLSRMSKDEIARARADEESGRRTADGKLVTKASKVDMVATILTHNSTRSGSSIDFAASAKNLACLDPALKRAWEAVRDLTPEAVGQALLGFLRQMHLQHFKPFDNVAQGWMIKGKKNGAGVGVLNLKHFLMQVRECAARNEYLMKFACQAKASWFEDIPDKVYRQVTIMALFFHRVTKRMINYPKVLRMTVKRFKEIRKEHNLMKNFGWFEKAKIWAVEMAMKGYIKAHKKNKVSEGKGSILIPLNIMEAVVKDKTRGTHDNAAAGWVLAKARCGMPTRGRPTNLKGWKRMMSYKFPAPTQWADLYETWNLAFVSQFDAYPVYYAKLLAPVVSCYQKEPDLYIYKRAIALYVFANWVAAAGGVERIPLTLGLDPRSADMIRRKAKQFVPLWSKLNKESSEEYYKLRVAERKKREASKPPSTYAKFKHILGKYKKKFTKWLNKGKMEDVRRHYSHRLRKATKRENKDGDLHRDDDDNDDEDKKKGGAFATIKSVLSGGDKKKKKKKKTRHGKKEDEEDQTKAGVDVPW